MSSEEKRQQPIRAYWIHDTVTDSRSVTGKFILRACKCSNCGYKSPGERPTCFKCGAIMEGRA